MTAMALDSFDKNSLSVPKIEYVEKLDSLNKAFDSKVQPTKGVFGINEIDKGNGWVQKIYRNENNQISSDYSLDGVLKYNRTKLDTGKWCKTSFDDNNLAYIKETTVTDKMGIKTYSAELAPEVTIVKGNFSATTDIFGRPILNEIKDLKIKDTGRENLSSKLRDSTYKEGDQRGHIIADSLGGTATKENIVAQMSEVNQGKMAQVENIVREYKAQGKKVDYKVKTNYVGSDKRPSSFEPEITVEGEVIELPSGLKKIYNNGEESSLAKVKTIAGEKAGLHNEAGIKTGKQAMMITGAISTVENVSAYMNGEISAEEMVIDIAKDTGTAGATGYAFGFVNSSVATAMQGSSHQLIQSLGKSNVPAAVISFGVTSFDSIVDYAQGEIDGQELAYDLGENAVGVAGSMAGMAAAGVAGAKVGAAVGTAVGTVVPGAGNVVGGAVGTTVGLVGGMVGYAVATEAYSTAVEVCATYGGEVVDAVGDFAVEASQTVTAEVEELGNKAQKIANDTIKLAESYGEEVANNVKAAIADFNVANALPW